MTKDELVAALRLQRIPNIGDITAKKLVNHCGSPTAIFSDKVGQLTKIEGVGSYTLKNLHDKAYLEAAEAEYDYIRKAEIQYTFFQEKEYPEYLKHCIDGPLLLFQRGRINLKSQKILSVVGTRNSTSYGMGFCEEFIADLSPLNPIIVSGFAYGIDISVQKAALKHHLQTIACLGHGLNQIYPKSHEEYTRVVEKNGGFITEFWSSSRPERENFLRRNRIVAGISQATIVVESAEKGGSLVTADIAGSYNRDVFALPGRAGDTYSVGCNNLIKQQKAQMITSAADLIYLLGWDLEEPKSRPSQKQLFVELNETEKAIHSSLQATGKRHLDRIVLDCNLPVFKVSSTLVQLEMKGLIRPLPGKLFEAL